MKAPFSKRPASDGEPGMCAFVQLGQTVTGVVAVPQLAAMQADTTSS